jgi:hypothetical protein
MSAIFQYLSGQPHHAHEEVRWSAGSDYPGQRSTEALFHIRLPHRRCVPADNSKKPRLRLDQGDNSKKRRDAITTGRSGQAVIGGLDRRITEGHDDGFLPCAKG